MAPLSSFCDFPRQRASCKRWGSITPLILFHGKQFQQLILGFILPSWVCFTSARSYSPPADIMGTTHARSRGPGEGMDGA